METIKLLAGCKNVKFEGLWRDPEGCYPVMPIFELTDLSAEEWNRRARELREEHAHKGKGAGNE